MFPSVCVSVRVIVLSQGGEGRGEEAHGGVKTRMAATRWDGGREAGNGKRETEGGDGDEMMRLYV